MMNNKTILTINIIGIILLGLCAIKMPYGYYQFAKIALFIGFIYGATLIYEKYKYLVPVYAGLAVLFNPFIKFAFRRNEWQVIDLIVVVILLIITVFQAFVKKK